jgi:putative phosphoribosyl transferase
MAELIRFKNRTQAGEQLAKRLERYAGRSDAIVLALPRGGVPVGFAVASALELPLDILLVRKLGVPGHEEYAMGAIASGGFYVLQSDVLNMLGISGSTVEAVAQDALKEIERREKLYRADRPAPQLEGRIVILVDDGLATGSTMRAAINVLRLAKPARIIAAVPVAAPDACRMLQSEVDEMICLSIPESFHAVGLWYEDFRQTRDDEVTSLLAQAEQKQARREDEQQEAQRHQ